MNQSALDGFVKIVEMDSFSAAAEALYLSQSALSQQIRTLEGQLQFELFQHSYYLSASLFSLLSSLSFFFNS